MIDEPHDHAAEQAVIGAMLIAAIVLADCRHAGRCRLLRQPAPRSVRGNGEMIRGGKDAGRGDGWRAGGRSRIPDRAGNNTPGAGNIQAYAEIVAERAGNSPRAGRRTRDSLLTGEGIGQASKAASQAQ